MGFSTSTAHHKVITLHSYVGAKEHYQKVKPIRGRTDDVRPLGDRKAAQFRIVENAPRDGNPLPTYAARLYNTDCIEWVQETDGTETMLLRHDGYATDTTVKFMYGVLPYPLCNTVALKNNKLRVDGWVVPYEGALRFRKNSDNKWECSNGESEYVHRIDRKKANAVRKRYKAFAEWFKGFSGLMGNSMPDDGSASEAFGRISFFNTPPHKLNQTTRTGPSKLDLRREFLALISADPATDEHAYDKFLDAAYWVIAMTWRASTTRFHFAWNPSELDNLLLKLHAHEVIVKTELPHGVVVKDLWATWMRGWIKDVEEQDVTQNA